MYSLQTDVKGVLRVVSGARVRKGEMGGREEMVGEQKGGWVGGGGGGGEEWC